MRGSGFSNLSTEEILRPVRPLYVAMTLVAALLLNLMPLSGWALMLRPDFVALTLLYWGIHQPRKIGFFPAWLLGLAMDVAEGSLFGQHALAYSVMMFGVRHQMLHVVVILLLMQVIVLVVRAAAGGEYPGWWYFVPSLIGALLWPGTRLLFTIPLRSRRNADEV